MGSGNIKKDNIAYPNGRWSLVKKMDVVKLAIFEILKKDF